MIDKGRNSARAVVAAWDGAGNRRAIGFTTRVVYWSDAGSPVEVRTNVQPTQLKFSPDSKLLGLAGAPLAAAMVDVDTGTFTELGAGLRRMLDDGTLGLEWTASPQRMIHLRKRGLTVWDGRVKCLT
ncbi:MAG: hypothetical protein ACOYN0_19540 [Phycisphaerales bacterium]